VFFSITLGIPLCVIGFLGLLDFTAHLPVEIQMWIFIIIVIVASILTGIAVAWDSIS